MKIQASIASSAFPPLLCALLVSTSVCARRHSGGTAFVQRNTATPLSSSSLSPPPVSALDTSAFSSERDAQIAASLLVATAALCRGGYQSAEYYDDRGYNGNDDDYYSKQYGDDSNYNYEDNYPYDDRDSSVRVFRAKVGCERAFAAGPSGSFRNRCRRANSLPLKCVVGWAIGCACACVCVCVFSFSFSFSARGAPVVSFLSPDRLFPKISRLPHALTHCFLPGLLASSTTTAKKAAGLVVLPFLCPTSSEPATEKLVCPCWPSEAP